SKLLNSAHRVLEAEVILCANFRAKKMITEIERNGGNYLLATHTSATVQSTSQIYIYRIN
ncbi:MAG: hypothetical protein ACERKO_08955, partial [Acetanaerobacterium sp.]